MYIRVFKGVTYYCKRGQYWILVSEKNSLSQNNAVHDFHRKTSALCKCQNALNQSTTVIKKMSVYNQNSNNFRLDGDLFTPITL